MAVDALELRPRTAVALFDAAIRVCATSTGVWALTLPAGAALIASLFNLAEAITTGQPLPEPVAWWTLAWAFRAVCQGAACHFVEQQVLSAAPPSARASFRAALARAPGLITAAMIMAVINTGLWLFTAGLGFLFLGAHAAGYAATMQGQGSALNVYGTSSRLLGSARGNAAWVRMFGLTQVLVGLNLHLAIAVGLYLAQSVLGFDVTFIDRFTSLDNATWLATLAATTFTLFEPLRAATGSLLLIDGRVRQEGLDLLAAAAQLPSRRPHLKPLLGPLATAVLLLVAMPALGDTLTARLKVVAQRCDMAPAAHEAIDGVGALPDEERSALARFVAHLERTAFDDEDCEAAEDDLREGLALVGEVATALPAQGDPRALAKQTLERPEFQVAPPAAEVSPEDAEAPGTFAKWWNELWRKFWEWLRQSDRNRERALDRPSGEAGALAGANVVMLVALVAVFAVLGYLLVRGRVTSREQAQLDESGAVTEQGLLNDSTSALARPPDSWAALADALAARGEYREAIRHLYLALLSRLHRDGCIDYDPTCSNWEYLLGFKGEGAVKAAFRDLTRRFDFAWYGNLDVTQPSWTAFRVTAAPILSAPRDEAARA
jgi:hypothetical protein